MADLYGIYPSRAEKVLQCFASGQADAAGLLSRSFLSPDAKQDALQRLRNRLRAIAD